MILPVRILPWLALAAFVACREPSSSPTALVPTPAPSVERGPAAMARDAGPGSPVAPEIQAMPVAALTDVPGGPLPTRPMPPVRPLGKGAVWQRLETATDRVLVEDRAGRFSLLDVSTGAVLATLPAPPSDASVRAGVVTLRGDPPRLVRLKDGAILAPVLDSGGSPLRESWLEAQPERATVLALARTTAGEELAGVVGPDLASAHLMRVPLDSTAFRYDVAEFGYGGWALVTMDRSKYGPQYGNEAPAYGVPASLLHGDRCVRPLLRENGELSCREYEAPSGMVVEDVRWLEGGFYLLDARSKETSYLESFLSNVAWGRQRLHWDALLHERYCTANQTRSVPARALVLCSAAREGDPDAVDVVWTPTAVFEFTAPTSARNQTGWGGSDSDAGWVVPLFDGTREAAATRYVDMRIPRLLTMPAVRPLDVASGVGLAPSALVEEKTATGSTMWLVDFDAATRRVVARIDDCPGVLSETSADKPLRSRWLVLSCGMPGPAGTLTVRPMWSEIIDTQTSARYRTPLFVEAMYADGRAVLSRRGAVAAESRADASDLFAVSF